MPSVANTSFGCISDLYMTIRQKIPSVYDSASLGPWTWALDHDLLLSLQLPGVSSITLIPAEITPTARESLTNQRGNPTGKCGHYS
jgi:hypothetical protein